ncbi:MAG: IclR family transcriptional regulator [Planctomycetota bacterium]|jgi:DNA-binding IclR family transcriptional regulator|nr:IclR family transcriptional regulator [Planctomycetota bacterium]
MINSVIRAIGILYLFREHKRLSLAEIADLSGLHKTTAHGLVLTLLSEHFLEQNKRTRRYSLGATLFELGGLYRARLDAFGFCLPYMRELSQITGKTVQLATLVDSDVVYLSRVVTKDFLGFSVADGVRRAAHCTSTGKAMLALLADADLDGIYPTDDLRARTSHSIRTREGLRENIRKIREQKYAVDYQEAELGLCGMAIGFRADRPMAISISCTADIMDSGQSRAYIEPLLELRCKIQEQFGAVSI